MFLGARIFVFVFEATPHNSRLILISKKCYFCQKTFEKVFRHLSKLLKKGYVDIVGVFMRYSIAS